jgi:hypothetical protein
VPAIVVTFDAGSDVQNQVIDAIRAHVSDLPVELVTVSVERDDVLGRRLAAAGTVATARRALGTFDIEVAPDNSLLVFFTEADGETTLIRRLQANPQGWKVALEHGAIVVRSLVEALLDGGRVGIAPGAGHGAEPKGNVERRPSDTTAATPDGALRTKAERPTEVEAAERRLAITAGYTATEFAPRVAWQSGFAVGAQWLVTPVVYAGARYTLFPALTVTTADAVVSVGRHPLEVLVGYRETGRVGLNGELGIVGDRVTRTTVRTAASLRATSPDARWLFAVTARGGFSWSPWGPLTASLRFGADFAVTRFAYAVDSAEPLVLPGWIRPKLELELGAHLW